MLGADRRPVSLALVLIFLLSVFEDPELFVPIGLESVSYQAVGRVHLHITSLGQLHLISSAIDLCSPKTVRFLQTRLNLGLHTQRHLQGQGCHRFDQQFGDRRI